MGRQAGRQPFSFLMSTDARALLVPHCLQNGLDNSLTNMVGADTEEKSNADTRRFLLL